MHILLDLFKDNNGKVVVPKIIQKKKLEFITETHDVLNWFYDNYERIDEYDYNEDEEQDVQTYISIKDTITFKRIKILYSIKSNNETKNIISIYQKFI